MAEAEKSGNSKLKDQALQSLSDDFDGHLRKNWINTYNKAADRVNVELYTLNKKYDNVDLINDHENNKKYTKEYVQLWERVYGQCLYEDFGEDPTMGLVETAKDWIYNAPFYLNARAFYEEEFGKYEE